MSEKSSVVSLDTGDSGESMGPVYPASDERQQGLLGWFSGGGFMNRVMEKTKVMARVCS